MAENGPIEIGVKVDTAQAARNIDDFSKKSRTALTSLSLVLQDLPFGFIGIQNNLPALFTAFAQLDTKSKGLKGVFKDLANSLEGPAGLVFGISAAVTVTTLLIQKYGSLSGALDAFIGKTITATDIQNKLNKELEGSVKSSSGEIANLESLVKILTNVNSTRSQQVGAYDEINKKYQGLLSNINSENAANKESIALIENRLELYKQQIILEGRREALVKLIGEASLEGEKALNALTNRNNLGFFDKLGLELRGLFAGIGGLGVINALNQDLGNAAKSANSYTNSLELVNTQLTNVNGKISELVKSGKKQKGKIPGLGEIIEGTQGEGIITTNLALFERYIQGQVRINNAGVDKMVRYRREQLNALELMPKKLEKQVGTLGLSLPFGPEAQKNLQQYYFGLFEIEGIYQRFKDAQMSGANEFARLQEQIKQFNSLKDSIENNLTRPFRDFFDELLDNGKVSFDAFVQLAKDAFKRILAQALASGIANLIAAALSGGGTLALGKLGAAKKISATLSGLGKVGGLFGSANFSGVQAGSMQMAGAVNLTLRGSDLVGSINRTNATINRVG
jgi:predicted  nucleic acid-binding Zn-ribbon protein